MCKYPALWSDVVEDGGGGGSCGKMDRNGDCRGRCGRCGSGVGGCSVSHAMIGVMVLGSVMLCVLMNYYYYW